MATYSSNTTLKANRAITGATIVAANGYAIVDYALTSSSAIGNLVSFVGSGGQSAIVQRYFGPGQSIPASFTDDFIAGFLMDGSGNAVFSTGTFSLRSGVEFINTP